MGPWFIRDAAQPFRPGCNLATIRMLITRGKVTRDSVVRGPTTGQFWRRADAVPGLSHLLGSCYSCRASADPGDSACRNCSAVFSAPDDRQSLGLGPVRLLPGHASAEAVAERALESAAYGVGSTSAAPAFAPEPAGSPVPTRTRAREREHAIVPLAPEPEAQSAPFRTTLSAEQKAEKLARIEQEAKLLLEERRARNQGRNAVIGVVIGLFLLAILAAVLVALPTGGAATPAAAPPAPPAVPPGAPSGAPSPAPSAAAP